MTNKTKLLPCPFCGSKAERYTLTDDANAGGDVISCTKCDACTRVVFGEKEGLVDAWNTRAPSADVRAVVEEPEAFELKKCADGYGHGGRWCGPAYNCWLDPRDRKERDEDFERRKSAASQRPVLLPDRIKWFDDNSDRRKAEIDGWNDCLDEIARLNK